MLNELIHKIYNFGIHADKDYIDLARARLINAFVLFLCMGFGGMTIYRLMFNEFYDFVLPNLRVFIALLFPLFLCFKGKQQIAIGISLVFLFLFLFNLNMKEFEIIHINSFRISTVVYLSLIPLFGAILFHAKVLRIVAYIICLIMFNYFGQEWELNVSAFVTYNCSYSLFFFSLMIFVDFVETSQLKMAKSNQETKKALKLLEESKRHLEEFTMICSHDLKEPLRNISSYATLLEREMHQVSNKKTELYFGFIESGVKTLSKLIEGLRHYMETEDDRNFVEETFCMDYFFSNIFTKMEGKFDKSIALNFTNNTEKRSLKSSRYALEIIFKNLIHNGLKYNESNEAKVDVVLNEHENYLEFTIKDNGQGFDESLLQKMFEPFKTLKNKSLNQSAGLGLSLCKKVLPHVNGNIKAFSTPNKGSVFVLTLKN